ncbi:fasciclin-3 isoform X2 [Diorhabda sublineata]|uniref:fasciclin-3 isoform X2 n=1 Tax=Diorhabda sublineata TaxID=1163346 RepID=UPI0024E12E91|nr:fasciclin-3 isoform X2 [Diorhabda sublineata]
MKTGLVIIFVFGLMQALWAAQVDVVNKELLVLPGQNATFLCRVGVALQYCRIELPGGRTFNLNKQLPSNSEVSYYGNGLDAGQCGVNIHQVTEKDNGAVKCTLGIPSETAESVGTMSLIVAKAPKQPELDLSRGTDSLRVYKINDVLEASCIVRDGRPVANISWYLDDEPIDNMALRMPTVIDLAKENLQSTVQNFSRVLQPIDNGRFLRCVAFHPAYPGGHSETKRQLDVKFPPLPIEDPIDKFGYQIGKVGLINITIEANPKPRIEWTVGGQLIKEGSTDNTGRIEAEAIRDLERGRYEANLRLAAVTKQDTEVEYILTAYNDQGSQTYRIKISTSPEPEGFKKFFRQKIYGVELGVGAIVGVVVLVLFIILLVSILIFAKMTGRWCFTGGSDTRHFGESDTESADVRPRETKTPNKLTSLFKKNKDQVASENELKPKLMKNEEKNLQEQPNVPEGDERALVYAELDLVRANMVPVVKNDDEKTEYAEIVYTPSDEGKESPKK